MEQSKRNRFSSRPLLSAVLLTALVLPLVAVASTVKPLYVHMNGLNDFLPTVLFVRPNQPVVFVNQDTGVHNIHEYAPIGGAMLKHIDEPAILGTPGPGHTVHTYTVRFKQLGAYYYICTVHAHLVKVYQENAHKAFYLPSKRKAVGGFGGSMAGVIIVTREKALLKTNPEIVHRRLLPKFWGNGDVASGH